MSGHARYSPTRARGELRRLRGCARPRALEWLARLLCGGWRTTPVARIRAHGRQLIACTPWPDDGRLPAGPAQPRGIGARSHGRRDTQPPASGHAATGVGQAVSGRRAGSLAARAPGVHVVCYWERLAPGRAARLLTRPRQYGWLFSLPRISEAHGGPVPWRVVASRRRTTLLQEDVGQ